MTAPTGSVVVTVAEYLTDEEVRAIGTRLAGVCDGPVDEAARWLTPVIEAIVARHVEAERERIAQAIEAARGALHPAFSEGDGNLPRGYTNAARIARDGTR